MFVWQLHELKNKIYKKPSVDVYLKKCMYANSL